MKHKLSINLILLSLMYTTFNLRRIMNILDQNLLKKCLKEFAFLVLKKLPYTNLKSAYTKPLDFYNIQPVNLKRVAQHFLNLLKISQKKLYLQRNSSF